MSLSIKEWENHFEEMGIPKLRKVTEAFKTLGQDDVFAEHYKGTGVFCLMVIAKAMLKRRSA